MDTQTEFAKFISFGFNDCTFYVLRFTGRDAASECFSFKIDLISDNKIPELNKFVRSKALFSIRTNQNTNSVYYGYPREAVQTSFHNGFYFYTVLLTPAFKRLSSLKDSAVFLDKNMRQIIEEILNMQKLPDIKYQFRLSKQLPSLEFSMQYNESPYDYICYRLEKEGCYYYFDKDGETVIFADSPSSHDRSQILLKFSKDNIKKIGEEEKYIDNFSHGQVSVQKDLILRGYNWQNPNKMLVGQEEISQTGIGVFYMGDELADSETEIKRTASIQAERLRCRQSYFSGSSCNALLRSGIVFTLSHHPYEDFNRDYLVTEIIHEGNQDAFIFRKLGIALPVKDAVSSYTNSFLCMEANRKFCTDNNIQRKKINGVISVFIDGDTNESPVLDSFGRYKVIFPFDISNRKDGKASCRIRKAQEQVGKDSGVSFPIQPGTEVLLRFTDGNPDLPVIVSCLVNNETGSVLGKGNASFSGIRSKGGAQLTLDENNNLSFSNQSGSCLQVLNDTSNNVLKTSDMNLTFSDVAQSVFAGMIFTNRSTFYSSNSASCDPKSSAVITFAQMLGISGMSLADSLSAKSSGNVVRNSVLTGVSSMVKLLSVLKFIYSEPYNIFISAKRNKSRADFQSFPSIGFLVLDFSLMVLSRAAAVVPAFIQMADKEKKNESDGGNKNSKDYFAFEKKETSREVILTAAIPLIAELASIIAVLFWKRKLNSKKIGGIMINSEDKNINIHAKTFLNIMSATGFLINTKQAEINQISDWGSPRIKPIKKNAPLMGNAEEEKNVEPDPCFLMHFSVDKVVKSMGAKKPSDCLVFFPSNFRADGWGTPADVTSGKGGFFIEDTDLYYIKSHNSISITSFSLRSDKLCQFGAPYQYIECRNSLDSEDENFSSIEMKAEDGSIKFRSKKLVCEHEAITGEKPTLTMEEDSIIGEVEKPKVVKEHFELQVRKIYFSCENTSNNKSTNWGINDDKFMARIYSNGSGHNEKLKFLIDDNKISIDTKEMIQVQGIFINEAKIEGSLSGFIKLGAGMEIKDTPIQDSLEKDIVRIFKRSQS